MKKTTIIFIILFTLMFSCSKTDKVKLSYKFKLGLEKTYKITSHISSTIKTGEFENTNTSEVSFNIVRKLEKLDGHDKAVFVFSYKDVKYKNSSDSKSEGQFSKILEGKSLTLVANKFGEITDVKGMEMLSDQTFSDFNFMKILLKANPIFPKEPVAIGEVWERTMDFPVENGLSKGTMIVYKRFVIPDSIDSKTGFCKIDTKIRMKLSLDKKTTDDFDIQQSKQGQGFTGSGSVLFDVEDGDVVKSNAAIIGKFAVEMNHPITNKKIFSKIKIVQNIQLEVL